MSASAMMSAPARTAGQLVAGHLAAEEWAERMARAGLPQRFILRLYMFARLNAGGGLFDPSSPAASEQASLLFEVVSPIVGQITARAGDRVVVLPLQTAWTVAVVREFDGRWAPVQRSCPDLGSLAALERDGAIRYLSCGIRPQKVTA